MYACTFSLKKNIQYEDKCLPRPCRKFLLVVSSPNDTISSHIFLLQFPKTNILVVAQSLKHFKSGDRMFTALQIFFKFRLIYCSWRISQDELLRSFTLDLFGLSCFRQTFSIMSERADSLSVTEGHNGCSCSSQWSNYACIFGTE